ncbi:dystrotelin isoform X2 [Danio rerio]|uniref:Dystrotelin isoform X2 n=1 Tax=Danio rerio TaxID=7955 RepID=A0A8M3B0A4_DANRE|nr:dystrotelin isoform X2 [Danio rerio]|eukprot:XP_009300511.1 dystrotelin isoform X2 [Danio rerio]
MDLDNIGLNEVRLAVYRAALKLRSLQKLCQMNLVLLQDLRPILNTLWSSGESTISLAQEDVQQHLEELFRSISPELPDQAVTEATDQTTRLLFKLFDRGQTGVILLRSVEAALIALCGDTLSAKQRALFRLAESYSGNQESDRGSISRSALRVLLEDLSQVPAVVQENHVFGHAETAVSSCFNGVISAGVTEEHFIWWLQSEPRLLLWLSTLYRISVSEAVQHRVHCHACKAFPITGLRYRCLKCLNVHLCQSCFLTERRSRKHKPSHSVLEYCTQPSWKESMASLASSARHALVPRHTRREAERKRALRAGSSAELRYSASNPALQFAAYADTHDAAAEASQTAAPAAVTVESKSLQTEEIQIPQRETAELQKDISVTQKAMRDLQRDKWLLEKEFQVWRVAAQSEHDSLEDKCSELKSMMETLNQHNQHLEEELDTVRHLLSLRHKEELKTSHSNLQLEQDGSINENNWTQPGLLKPHESSSTEHEVEERGTRQERRFEEEEDTLYDLSEDISTNLDDSESILPQDVHTALAQREEEELQEEEEGLHEKEEGLPTEEEELQHDRQDPSFFHGCMSDFAPDGHSDDSEMDDEEDLCELVQRLRNELSLYTASGSVCLQKEMLMTAAEGVRDSVSHLVTSVKSSSLA